MRKTLYILSVSALLLCLPAVSGDDKKPSKAVSELMQKKLQHSQKVLEGIALNDCDKIVKHAEELISLSKLAEWKVLKTPKYEVYSNEFRRTAQTMIDEAKNKNLDGATLAYLDMTMNCVKCHKHVREERVVRND
jgi:hypothetical protein